MYIERQMPLKLIVRWTRKSTKVFFINALIPVALHTVFNMTWLTIPWSLVALVGTAVAFLISFQNNSAYDRVWEARKIWGGIVNETRTFTLFVRDMIDDNPEAVKTILYRHRAWLTSLRYALRQHKSWEIPVVSDPEHVKIFNKLRYNPERSEDFEEVLKPLLSDKDFEMVMKHPNKASAILTLQSKHIAEIKAKKGMWEFCFLELERLIKEFYTLQGKSERIKNFPYPRQYFTLGLHLTWAFILLLPYAIIPEFTKIGVNLQEFTGVDPVYFSVSSIPFIVCVSWIFHTMGRMGRAGENPFEGTIHDVPISTIARTLEIEISHLLNEPEDIRPKQFPHVGAVQM